MPRWWRDSRQDRVCLAFPAHRSTLMPDNSPCEVYSMWIGPKNFQIFVLQWSGLFWCVCLLSCLVPRRWPNQPHCEGHWTLVVLGVDIVHLPTMSNAWRHFIPPLTFWWLIMLSQYCQGCSSLTPLVSWILRKGFEVCVYCTTCAEGQGLTVVLTFYFGRLFDVHVGRFDTYNSEHFVNQSTQSQSWHETLGPG